ncbi:sensor histidine kinase [Geodermatophilus sp. URMC 63]
MPGVRTRWHALPLVVRDGLLALVLSVVGQVELLVQAHEVVGPRLLQHAAFLVMTASVAARRTRPLAAAATLAAGLAGQTLLGAAPAAAGYVATLVLTWSVAQYTDRRRDALLGLAAVLAAVEVYPFVADEVTLGDEVVNIAVPALVWFFARLARERLDRAVQAEREALAARERARDEGRRRADAVAAERRRIAREMHDVVGHGVTLMLLHADAAQAGLAGREPATAQALDVVLTAGRTALADLHRLLRVLRAGEDPDDRQAGGLADVDRLVDGAVAAGLAATLVREGGDHLVPAAVGATAFRVVQEALTNVLKHAPGACVQVRLTTTGSALAVEVVDDGGTRPGAVGVPGFGLAGIRERVALFDGQAVAGPRTDEPGWQVRAVLPLAVGVPAAA